MKFGSKVIEWEASDETFGECQNMVRRGPILQLGSDRRVLFADGWQAENVDTVVYATGYHYTFPFLENSGLITVQDNRLVSGATRAKHCIHNRSNSVCVSSIQARQ